MSVLTWLIMGLVAISLIFFFSALLFLVQVILSTRKLRALPDRPPKKKKAKRRWQQLRRTLTAKRKRGVYAIACFAFFGLISGAAGAYSLYYQSINLSAEDEKSIVRSYFLVRDFQSELEKAANQSETEEASQQNIRYLATSLSAYTSSKASTINTTDGQSSLNRYYASLAQLGMNATRESGNFYGNPTLVDEFNTDITKVMEYETAAFDYFKINQEALKNEDTGNDS